MRENDVIILNGQGQNNNNNETRRALTFREALECLGCSATASAGTSLDSISVEEVSPAFGISKKEHNVMDIRSLCHLGDAPLIQAPSYELEQDLAPHDKVSRRLPQIPIDNTGWHPEINGHDRVRGCQRRVMMMHSTPTVYTTPEGVKMHPTHQEVSLIPCYIAIAADNQSRTMAPNVVQATSAYNNNRSVPITLLSSVGVTSASSMPTSRELISIKKCTHCGTCNTPSWRRSQDGRLLCNACGLYEKINDCPRKFRIGLDGSLRVRRLSSRERGHVNVDTVKR